MENETINNLKTISLKEIISEINSDKYKWNGYDNGDTIFNYQSRKCVQTALILIAVSKVLDLEGKEEDILSGKIDIGITNEEAKTLFYEHIRHLGKISNSYESTDELDLKHLGNMFKSIANYF